MAVEVWIGEKPDNPNERKAIIALANGLDRLEGLYVMIANFSVGGRAIDLVILKSDAIFILELKHVDGTVFGAVNGKWKVVSKNGSTKELNPGRKNPYGQVVNYFYNFTNFLNDHKHQIVSAQKANDVDFRAAKRVIVLVPTIEPGSEIQLDWKVQVKGLDELPTYLLTERSNGIELADEELLRIPKLLHCEPWQELNDLLAGVMPPWASTPTEPPAPAPLQAPVEASAPEPRTPAPWWQDTLHRINSWPGGVLTVFAVLALVWTLATIPPVINNSSEPVVPATVAPVPTIPEKGLGVDVANGIASVHQRVGRRWDPEQRTWVGAEEDSADILVTLETVDFNNGQIKLEWTVENRRGTPAKMALVPENIVIVDNQIRYVIDSARSEPRGVLEVRRGEKRTATIIVPQNVRPNAITLKIALASQPFGEASWIVNVPQ